MPKFIKIVFLGMVAWFGTNVAHSYVVNNCLNSYGRYVGYYGYSCTAIPTLNEEATILLVLILIATYSICINPKKKIS